MIAILISLLIGLLSLFLSVLDVDRKFILLLAILAITIATTSFSLYYLFTLILFLTFALFSYLYKDPISISSVAITYPIVLILPRYSGINFAILLQAYSFALLPLFRRNVESMLYIFISSALFLATFIIGAIYQMNILEVGSLLLYLGIFPLNPLVYLSTYTLKNYDAAIFFGSKIPIFLYIYNLAPSLLFSEIFGLAFSFIPLIYAFYKHSLNRIILLSLSQIGIALAVFPFISPGYVMPFVFSFSIAEALVMLSLSYSSNLMFISSLSMIGLPLFPGFISKYLLFLSIYSFPNISIFFAMVVGLQAIALFSYLNPNKPTKKDYIFSLCLILLFLMLWYSFRIPF